MKTSEEGRSWVDDELESAFQAPGDMKSAQIVAKLADDPDAVAAVDRLDPALVARALPALTASLEQNGFDKKPEVEQMLEALRARVGPAGRADDDADPFIAALAAAAGRSVMLADLIGADPGSRHVSDRIAAALERAAASPRAAVVETDGKAWRLVTPAAFLAAAVADEPPTTTGEPPNSFAFLAARLSDLPETAEGTGNIESASSKADPAMFLAAPALVEVMTEAARLARRTEPDQRTLHARHLAAALLGTISGRQAFVDLGVASDAPGPWLADLLSAYVEFLRNRSSDPGDEMLRDEYLGALSSTDLEAGLVVPSRARLQLPGYDTDFVPARRRLDTPSALAADRLGVAEDARALADLICLRRAAPPIAIGIFGAWGSGKSMFMRMIEEAAEANRARAIEMADEDVKPPFVRNVVHVWFNAWHYVDANLWASLVSHIFRELSRQGKERDLFDDAQLGRLVRELELAGQAESEAAKALKAVANEIDVAKNSLQGIDEQKACVGRYLAAKYVQSLDGAVIKNVQAALTKIGAPAAVETFDQLTALTTEARTFGGQLGLMVSAVAAGDGYAWCRIAWGLLFLFGMMGLGFVGTIYAPAELHDAIQSLAPTLGLLTGLGAWLLPHLRRVTDALGSLTAAEASAAKDRQANEKARREAENKLAALEDRRQRQEAELDARRRERERLEALRRGDRPAELLARFIEDRAGVEGYRKHLGLLSRIRGDFELMSDLMAHRTEPHRTEPHRSEHCTPNPCSAVKLPQIDRIVLYIDDLDRCRDEQVVEVLEAIHLLLAFDLFVVVVGVDSRWVEGALSRFYDHQLAPSVLPNEPCASSERATVADYLEKIFQIPFRLRALDFSDGGGYDALVTSLIGEVTRAEPDEDSKGREVGNGPTTPAALRTVPVAPPARKESAAEILERVTLTAVELDAIRALGPLIGRSPRTVKRFVNLYRLLRTRRRGPKLDAFLAEPAAGDGAALYRLAILWLAFETGLSLAQKRRLQAVLTAPTDERPLQLPKSDPKAVSSPKPRADKVASPLASFFESLEDAPLRDAVEDAWEAVQNATLAQIEDVSADARRYCFD